MSETNQTQNKKREQSWADKLGPGAIWAAVTDIPRFMTSKHVETSKKLALILSVIYLLSPVDVLPELFAPFIGWIDDVALGALILGMVQAARVREIEEDNSPAGSDPEKVIDVEAQPVL